MDARTAATGTIQLSTRKLASQSSITQTFLGDGPRQDSPTGPGVPMHAWVVHAAVIAHALVMAYSDPLISSNPVTHVLLFSLQFFLFLAIPLAFFFVTSNTLFIQLGMYKQYIKLHWRLMAATLLAFPFFIIARSFDLVWEYNQKPHLSVWNVKWFFAVWALSKITLLIFYCAAAAAVGNGMEQRFYTPDCMLDVTM